MADQELADLTEDTSPADTDWWYKVDEDGTVDRKVSTANLRTTIVSAEATARAAGDSSTAATAASALAAHEADTTNIHGITNTANLETTSGAQAKADAKVSDTAYAGSWDAVTAVAPSKNAVYDKVETVVASVTAEAALARNADNLTSGTVADARIASTIARDSEVTAAVAAHEADTTNVHGIADTAALVTTSTLTELVQDVVGAMATDGTTVNFTYDDTAGTLTAEVQGLSSASLSDFAEAVRDRLGATLVAGTGITVTVDDPGDTVTIATTVTQYTDEMARDALGAALVAGNNIDITVDDAANTITVDVEALTTADLSDFATAVDERARDALGAALVAGSNITITPNDGANTITIDASGGGGSGTVETIVEGTGITVDDTDPANPIVATTITQYTDEAARDAIGAALVAGNNIDITVDDAGNTITVDVEALTSADLSDFASAVDERARDALGSALTAGAGITITPNDGADTITVASSITQYTDEMAQDSVGGALTDTSTIDFTYNDGANTITADVKDGSITAAKVAADVATQAELDAKVSDTAYDATTWNGVTDIAPSKNAVRDEIEAVLAGTQPLDSDLTAIAALSTTSFGRAFLALADAAATRTAIGLVLGTDIYSKAAVDSGFQPLDSDLTAIAALTTTATGRSLLAAADAAAIRTIAGAAAQENVTALKTANYSAAVGDYVPVDTTSGTVTVTLPTAPADGSMVLVKHSAGANTLTIARGGSDVFNLAGGVTSFTSAGINAHYTLTYDSGASIWYIESSFSKGLLDTIYAGLASPALTGNPTAPTQSAGNNSTRLATTAYADALVADAINDGTTGIAPSQNAVFDALALKAPLASPALTGHPTGVTESPGDNSTRLASTAYADAKVADTAYAGSWDGVTGIAPSKNAVYDQMELKAPLASPALTGNPTAPTASVGDNDTSIATTAFVQAAQLVVIPADKTADYTLVLGDAGSSIGVSSATAKNVTVPLSSSVAYPIGTMIEVRQVGAGQVTIVATGGVTLRSAGGALKIRAQYGAASLLKIDTDTWSVQGDLTT